MAIHTVNTSTSVKKWKCFVITKSYAGSWTEHPYFDNYTLRKTVKLSLYGYITLFKYSKKNINETDYQALKGKYIG
jgi:hypothetical protein